MRENIDDVYPDYVSIEYNMIEIDGVYTISLIITNYPQRIGFLDVLQSIPKDIENKYSIYVSKQDETKILKDLTNVIANTKSEKKTVNNNQLDVDVLENITEKAKELRRKVQIENEGIYRVSIYISVSDIIKQKAIEKIKIIQNSLYLKGIIARVGNFRQKELYIANLPLNNIEEYLNKSTYMTFTTTGLSYLFPYYNNYIIEKEGVQFGITGNNLCIIDMFSKDSINSNMLVFGSSGSGKSYFAHLLVIRGAINGIMQRVIDPEGEYIYLAKTLGGLVIEDDINIMYFCENYIKKNKKIYIDKKISTIIEIIDTRNIFIEKEKELIVLAMKKAYETRGITKEEKTLYTINDSKGILVDKKYLDKSQFPNLEDVFENIEDELYRKKIIRKIKLVLSDKTIISRKTINKNNIIIYNLDKIQDNKKQVYIYIYLELIKEDYGDKMQIYIDELWKCIEYGKNEKIINEISDMFKSIRKNNAGIIAITQDISDLFKYENGYFAKSILNNSYFKAYFKMEYTDLEVLEKMGLSEARQMDKIRKLNKGNAIITRGWNSFCLNVVSDENEKRYIEKGVNENEKNCNSNG